MTRTNVHKTNQTILISCSLDKVHTNESCFPLWAKYGRNICVKNSKSQKWFLSPTVPWTENELIACDMIQKNSKQKNLFTCFISSSIVLKLLLHGKCKHECHDDKTIQEPRKTQGPYNGMFWRQDWDVNHITQPPSQEQGHYDLTSSSLECPWTELQLWRPGEFGHTQNKTSSEPTQYVIKFFM